MLPLWFAMLVALASAHDDYTSSEITFAWMFLGIVLFCVLGVWLSMAWNDRPPEHRVIRYVIHRRDIVPQV